MTTKEKNKITWKEIGILIFAISVIILFFYTLINIQDLGNDCKELENNNCQRDKCYYEELGSLYSDEYSQCLIIHELGE